MHDTNNFLYYCATNILFRPRGGTKKEFFVVDAREVAPQAAHRDMFSGTYLSKYLLNIPDILVLITHHCAMHMVTITPIALFTP